VHVSNGAEAPVKVRLPASGPAVAVYFLHGCGYGAAAARFAEYVFLMASGKRHVVPMRVLGLDGGGESGANIQDWWPSYPHREFSSAHRYVVTEGGDPAFYERYLYTLEWVNPDPKDALVAVEVRSVPEVDATLGVLAVTVRRPA
jgi:hypothetical protein